MMWRSKGFSRAARRSRRGACLVALLAAMLLALPMAHCAEVRGAATGHHPHVAMSAEVIDHDHAVAAGPLDGHCLLHFDHCIAEPVLRATAETVPAQHMVLLAPAPAVLLVAGADDIFSAGPRDPPCRMPALGGRATLTRLCIARR